MYCASSDRHAARDCAEQVGKQQLSYLGTSAPKFVSYEQPSVQPMQDCVLSGAAKAKIEGLLAGRPGFDGSAPLEELRRASRSESWSARRCRPKEASGNQADSLQDAPRAQWFRPAMRTSRRQADRGTRQPAKAASQGQPAHPPGFTQCPGVAKTCRERGSRRCLPSGWAGQIIGSCSAIQLAGCPRQLARWGLASQPIPQAADPRL